MEIRCKICDNVIDSGMRICPFCETEIMAPSSSSGDAAAMDRKFTESLASSGNTGYTAPGTISCAKCRTAYGAAFARCPVCGLPKPSPVREPVRSGDIYGTVYAGAPSFEHSFDSVEKPKYDDIPKPEAKAKSSTSTPYYKAVSKPVFREAPPYPSMTPTPPMPMTMPMTPKKKGLSSVKIPDGVAVGIIVTLMALLGGVTFFISGSM